MFTQDKLNSIYKSGTLGKKIIFLESTTSTNDLALQKSREGIDNEGLVIVADSQSSGRGRMGRHWVSPPGKNLYFSVLLAPPARTGDIPLITFSAAVAVARAIRTVTGLTADIKWPNDILINEKKACGILVEMRSAGGKQGLIAVGVGINVNMTIDLLPEDIQPISTSLIHESGSETDRLELLSTILDELECGYKNLLNGNKRALISDWLRLNSTIGKSVRVRAQQRTLSGIAEGISDSGELILRLPSGETETLNAGDVTILKE